MAVPPPAPNAGAGLPAAHGRAGAVNNAACKAAVAAQLFVANAATEGVGQPIVANKGKAAVMHWPYCINNIKIIGGINCAILASTNMIGEAAIRAIGTAAARSAKAAVAATGRTGAATTINSKLELLHKQCKLGIEISNLISIAHCKQMIHMTEEKEAKEMEGGN
jgi:hypothetical protein